MLSAIYFFLIIFTGSIIGIQIGLYYVLRSKDIPFLRAITYSFSIWVTPFLVIEANVYSYKHRDQMVEEISKKNDYDEIEKLNLSRFLDGRLFLIAVVGLAIRDLFTLKENIFILVEGIEEYEQRVARNKAKSIIARNGFLGFFIKSAPFLKSGLVSHANDQIITSKIKFKQL